MRAEQGRAKPRWRMQEAVRAGSGYRLKTVPWPSSHFQVGLEPWTQYSTSRDLHLSSLKMGEQHFPG